MMLVVIPRVVGLLLEQQAMSDVNGREHPSLPSNDSPHTRCRLGHSFACGLMRLAWSPLRLEGHQYYDLEYRQHYSFDY